MYDYAHKTATLGPLSPEEEPAGYDLCLEHARHQQVPSGWKLERISAPPPAETTGAGWLASLADEVRSIGWGDDPPPPRQDASGRDRVQRGHLRVIDDL